MVNPFHALLSLINYLHNLHSYIYHQETSTGQIYKYENEKWFYCPIFKGKNFPSRVVKALDAYNLWAKLGFEPRTSCTQSRNHTPRPFGHLTLNCVCCFTFPSAKRQKKEKIISKKVYSTEYSQAVTHPSTNSAQYCLTTVIRRELVHSIWYGRRHLQHVKAMP